MIPTDVPGMDEVLGGGLVESFFYVFAGSPGSGKTITTQQIALNWMNAGKRVLIILTETTPDKWAVTYRPFTEQLRSHHKEGRLLILTWRSLRNQYLTQESDKGSSWYAEARAVVNAIRDAVKQHGVSLVIIDSVTTWFDSAPSIGRKVVGIIQQSVSWLPVTVIAIAQGTNAAYSEAKVYGGVGIYHNSDGVLQYERIVDRDGNVHYTVEVIKHRGMNHSRKLHPLVITPYQGVVVLSEYQVYRYRGNVIVTKVKSKQDLYIAPQEQAAMRGEDVGKVDRPFYEQQEQAAQGQQEKSFADIIAEAQEEAQEEAGREEQEEGTEGREDGQEPALF